MSIKSVDLGYKLRNDTFGSSSAADGLRFEKCAILNASKRGQKIDGDLEFVGCTFPESVRFVRWDLGGNLIFRNCEFLGQVTLENCECQGNLTFDGCNSGANNVPTAFSFLNCVVRGQTSINDCRFSGRPSIVRSKFHGAVAYSAPTESVPAYCPAFSHAVFESELTVEVPSDNASARFHLCAFTPQSQVEISLPTAEASLDFTGCIIEGDLCVRAYSPNSQSRIRLELKGSEIRGSFDIRRLRLVWLNIEDAVLRSGTLILDRESMAARIGWGDLLACRFVAADRTGLLRREQYVVDRTQVVAGWDRTSNENLDQVAREYEELCNMFAATAGSDWQEDFCRYKFMEYRRLYLRAEAGWVYYFLSAIVLGVFAVFLLWLVLCPIEWLGYGFFGLLILGILPLPIRSYRAARAALWSRVVNKSLLGHGVAFRRIALFAGSQIIAFALIYGLGTAFTPRIGQVVYSQNNCDVGILHRPAEHKLGEHCQVNGSWQGCVRLKCFTRSGTKSWVG